MSKKLKKYLNFARELKKLWSMKVAVVIYKAWLKSEICGTEEQIH